MRIYNSHLRQATIQPKDLVPRRHSSKGALIFHRSGWTTVVIQQQGGLNEATLV